MQLKSVLLFTALAASVSARPFKHHGKRACTTDAPAPPVETPVPPVETPTPEPAPPAETPAPQPEPQPEPQPGPEPQPEPEPAPAPAPEPAAAQCNKKDGDFCIDGFGGRTPSGGSGVTYKGNLGDPYGSNIIRVDSSIADQYKYTVKFVGSNKMAGNYKIVVWNKIGPDGGMNGFFTPNKALDFSLAPGEEIFVAFDEDTNGGWGAALGDSLPLSDWGTYASNWGEFDFGSTINNGWSGFDVSMIVPQNANKPIQGMRICDITGSSQGVCSTITTDAKRVDNAYTVAETDIGGIGGNLSPGKVRLEAIIEFDD